MLKVKFSSYKLFLFLCVFLVLSILIFYIGPELARLRLEGWQIKNIENQSKGQIGDVFGGTIGPLIAWLAAFLTFAAFWVQYKANEQQKVYLKQQRFEDTFFRLLENHQRIVESMDLLKEDTTEVVAKSRDCFKKMYKDFTNKNYKLNENSKDISSVNKIYNKIQDLYKADLHHYFRLLYHILKYIKYSEIEEDDKYKYSSILRAVLSPYEIVFIFYNCLHEYGVSHFKPLVEEFSFLKNLDESLLIDDGHKQQYHPLAFASNTKRKELFVDWKRTENIK